MSVISLVSVNDALAGATGAQAAALTAQGSSLAATYDWAFLFGPGLVGGPLLILSFGMILFGVYDNGPGPAGLMALPEIIWEVSLGVYAAWKGFRPSPVTKTLDIREETPKPQMAMA